MKQVKLNTVNAGEKFNYGGINWIVLEQQDGRAICLAADTFKNAAFEKNGNNNFAESSLRKYLNGTFLKKLTAEGANAATFLEFETDLTTDDGMPDYGTSKDKLSLITCDQYRKYRRCGVLTVLNKWWWTATARTASGSYGVRSVYSNGTLNSDYAYYGGYGVRPLCNLASSILVSIDSATMTKATTKVEICIPEKYIPKNCDDCFMRTSSNNCAASKVPHFSVNDKKYMECRHRGCPLKSIEQHDQEARREFAEKLKELKVGFLQGRGNGQYIDKYYVEVEDVDELLEKY